MLLAREKKIVTLLIEHEDKLTTTQIATSLKVSSRTIKADIKKINEELEKHSCRINSQQGVGLWIEYDNHEAKKYLKEVTRDAIADKPGIAPGYAMGVLAGLMKTGFVGGLVGALIAGWFVLQMKKIKVPKALQGIMPIMFIPVLSTLIVGLLMWYVIGVPIAWLMGIVTGWLTALSAGSRFVLGAVIGAMIAFDNGGPVNKTAALFVNGLNADGFFIPTSAKMCAGMTSPLGIAISTVLPWSRNKFTKTEKEQALSLVILSCCYVQEGVIPFQLKDPVRLTASICVGGAITGGLCMMFGLESPAVHGGVFSVAMTSNPLLFIGLWLLGGCITGLLYSILKRPLAEGAEDEEMENPLI